MKNYLKLITVMIIVAVFLINSVLGANSPNEIWDLNSKAKEILIGKVLNIALTPNSWNLTHNYSESKYFELEIEQVRKTSNNLTEGKIIKIPFYHFLLPISGGAEVIVINGELIKIYANPTRIDNDVFELAISGDSVVHLKNLSDPNIDEVSKDCFVYKGGLVVHFKKGTTEEQADDMLWKLHPATAYTLSPIYPLNLSYIVRFIRNSTYSNIKKYADAYQKEESIKDVRLRNHNVSCYPDYSENLEKILTEEVKYERIDAIGTINCLKGCIFRYDNTSNAIFSPNDQIMKFAENNQTVRIIGELIVRNWCGQEKWKPIKETCKQQLLIINEVIPITPSTPLEEFELNIPQKIWKWILNLFGGNL